MTNGSVYTEDTLVQQTAADYSELQPGWQSIHGCNNDDFGPNIRFGHNTARRLYE